MSRPSDRQYVSPKANIHTETSLGMGVHIGAWTDVPKGCCIGSGTVLEAGCVLAPGVRVESYVTIGAHCVIGAAGYDPDRLSTAASLSYAPAPVTRIGADVWIGAGVVVRAGIQIGTGAIIEDGAVVTEDVGAFEIWQGQPAKFRAMRFEAETIAALFDLSWWSREPHELQGLPLEDVCAALVHLRGGGTDEKSEPGPSEEQTRKQRPDLAALQALIDAVPTAPQKPPSKVQLQFADFLNDKLLQANAPQVLMDTLTEFAAKIYGAYDLENPADILILNRKLTHLIELTRARADEEAPLPASLRTQIREIMRTKA